MKRAVQAQLSHLDRCLLALLNERAWLLQGLAGDAVRPAIEDLLRRSAGPFPPDALRAVFRAVERGCTAAEGTR